MVGLGWFLRASANAKGCAQWPAALVGLVGIGGFAKANRRTKICRACSKRALSTARTVVGLVGYGGCLTANRRAKFGAQLRECRALARVRKQGFEVMLKGVRVDLGCFGRSSSRRASKRAPHGGKSGLGSGA